MIKVKVGVQEIVRSIKVDEGILVSTGLGELRGSVVRVGMMGFVSTNIVLYTIGLIAKYMV